MANKIFVRALCLLVALALAACGGGNDSGPPPTANAGSAQTVLAGADVALDGSASSAPDGATLTYSWALTGKPAGSAAALAAPTAAKPSFTADIAGTYTASLIVSSGQSSSAPAAVTITALATDTLTIATDIAEPLAGTVKLSLSSAAPVMEVRWYQDLIFLGSGVTLNWNTRGLANGAHQVMASVKISATKTVEVRRAVNLANPTIILAGSVANPSAGTYLVTINATSAFGVASVAATLDGTPLATLTSPNACRTDAAPSPGQPCDTLTLYQFQVLNPASGNHTVVATGMDGAGSSDQISIAVPVSNAPAITLTSPVNNAIVYGSLLVAGSVATDKPGATVTVTARLDNVKILDAQGPSFSASYDVAGLAPRGYTLNVDATDSTGDASGTRRTVFVAASAATAYAPMPGLGGDMVVWALDGAQLVYSVRTEDHPGIGEKLRLRDLVSAAEVELDGTTNSDRNNNAFEHWQINAGYVYASGQAADCSSISCVYRWGRDGVRTNISNGSPWAVGTRHTKPVVHDGYVLWANDSSYTLYNLATGAYTRVVPNTGAVSPGSTDIAYSGSYDFAVSGGVVRVFYSQWIDLPRTSDVVRWDSDTRLSTRLSTAGQLSNSVQTDGTRVAWLSAPAGDTSGKASLRVQSIGGGAVTTLATGSAQSFVLHDGVLAWIEDSGTGPVVKALKGIDTVSLSSDGAAALLSAGGAYVAYEAGGKTYTWSAATGVSKLLLEFKPLGEVTIKGNTVYFSLGTEGPGFVGGSALYKVPLN